MIKERPTSNEETIEAYLRSCKRLVDNIKNGNKTEQVTPKPELKKKAPIKKKKTYTTILKVASLVGLTLICGSLYASLFVPDVVQTIMAIIGNFDPFSNFRGDGSIDNYVMFL